MRRLPKESTYMNVPLPFLWGENESVSKNPRFWSHPEHMRTLMLQVLVWEARDDEGSDRYRLRSHIERVITFFVWQRERVPVRRVLTEILQLNDAEIDLTAIEFVDRYFRDRDWSCVDPVNNVWARPHYVPSDDAPFFDPDGPVEVDDDEIFHTLSTLEHLRPDDNKPFDFR